LEPNSLLGLNEIYSNKTRIISSMSEVLGLSISMFWVNVAYADYLCYLPRQGLINALMLMGKTENALNIQTPPTSP